MLRVGFCLGCHPGTDDRYAEFSPAVERFRAGACNISSEVW